MRGRGRGRGAGGHPPPLCLARQPLPLGSQTSAPPPFSSLPPASKPGSSSNEPGDSGGSPVAPHNVVAAGGQVALANLGNWVSWVKHTTLSAFQPPKHELSPEEVDLRQASGVSQGGRGEGG